MDGVALIHNLYQSWEALCDCRNSEQENRKKMLEDLKMSTKASEGMLVQEAKLKYEDASKLVVECNFEFYRIRALNELYTTNG